VSAASFPTLDQAPADHVLRARFEVLAEWGIPLVDARAIAETASVDVVEALDLIRRGCPADLIIPILG
jgi:hypothetical protein